MTDHKHNNARPSSLGSKVSELLPEAKLVAGRDLVASSCCSSAGLVQAGDLYFAIDGDYQDEPLLAAARGAAGVVSQRQIADLKLPQYLVADVKLSFARYCHKLVGEPSHSAELIGVVGDSQAAAIPRLLAATFSAIDSPAAWWDGRWMSDADNEINDAGHQTAAPLVASWLSRSVANGAKQAAAHLELTVEKTEAFAACRIKTLCLAGVPREDSAAGTLAVNRERVAQLIEQLPPEGVIVANATNQDCCHQIATANHRVLSYGLNHAADISGEVLERHSGGQTLLVRYGRESVAIETRTIGDDHAENCLAAITVGVAHGGELRRVAAGIEAAPRPPATLEPVVLGQDFTVFLDQANNANRVRSAVTAVEQITSGRLLTVVGGASPTKDPRQLSAAANKSDLVITSGKPGPGLSDRTDFRFVEEPFAAIALAVALAEQGDAVMITGVDVDSQGHCDQADVVRELIALRHANTPPGWAA